MESFVRPYQHHLKSNVEEELQNKTKSNTKMKKKIVNYLFKSYFLLTGLFECECTDSQFQSAVWREASVLQLELGHSFIQCYECIILPILIVCVWRRLHRTGVAMLGFFL